MNHNEIPDLKMKNHNHILNLLEIESINNRFDFQYI